LSLLSLIKRYEAQPAIQESFDDLTKQYDYDKLVSIPEEKSITEKEVVEVSDLFTELAPEPPKVQPESVDLEVEKKVEELSDFDQELQGVIDLDVATTLLDEGGLLDNNPIKSVNDVVFQNQIQIGLNDRIAFVKHLFNENQEDFNRVISQLNSFKDLKEAKSFIHKVVRPDYDWSSQEELQDRLMNLVERKFN
jgi:predicted nucleotidyltransferase